MYSFCAEAMRTTAQPPVSMCGRARHKRFGIGWEPHGGSSFP